MRAKFTCTWEGGALLLSQHVLTIRTARLF